MSTSVLERESLFVPNHARDIEIIFPSAITKRDYAFLGKDFDGSKVMMARRRGDVKAVVAFRPLPVAFYVHSLWFSGAIDLDYDGEAITCLFRQLRRACSDLGYREIEFQCMDEMIPVFPFLVEACGAKLTGVFGVIPGIDRRVTKSPKGEGQ